MKNELTNKDKARIFALYLGCEIINPDNAFTRNYVCDGFEISLIEKGQSNNQLILKPLSAILDEDAIEVAKMNYSNRDEKIDGAKERYIRSTKTYILNPVEVLQYPIVDFLRSRGYALPYKGIDLFEAGIAIEKQLVNNK